MDLPRQAMATSCFRIGHKGNPRCGTRPNQWRGHARLPFVTGPTAVPELVAKALDLARQRGFITTTRNETGRLLAALAASRGGTLAELGTGTGVGSAWLASGAPPKARIVSAELDSVLAEEVQHLFAEIDNVEITAGDWSTLSEYAPFSLLFVDVREVMENVDALADLIEPGGIAVLDDFVPSSHWPPIVDGHVDTIREQWLTDERFVAVELLIDPDASLLIATRR
jgi:predicted O-methyltransferase YrrM